MPRSSYSPSNSAGSRWAVRIVPLFIAGVFAIATYAVVGRLCLGYLYRQKRQSGIVRAFLALYFILLLLTAAAYLRTYLAVRIDSGLVPLSQEEVDRRALEKTRNRRDRRDRDAEERPGCPPDQNPDSPGLETFYSKDVFLCEVDGCPKWCSECRQWKPDRAHHSSELGRCVRKMDHFCPWVGGMVSETSFNFFTQFTVYCTLFSVVSLAIGLRCLHQRHRDQEPVDGWVVAVIVMACVFGSFACGMSVTSLRFILTNTTNIDLLQKPQTFTLAVRIPRATPTTDKYPTMIYPLRVSPRPVSASQQPYLSDASSIRDGQAERKFAILHTQPQENPWNLGLAQNWKSVMGNHVVEWMLPVRHSPCCNHESMESDYRYGPLVPSLRRRHGVPDIDAACDGGGVEMQDARRC